MKLAFLGENVISKASKICEHEGDLSVPENRQKVEQAIISYYREQKVVATGLINKPPEQYTDKPRYVLPVLRPKATCLLNNRLSLLHPAGTFFPPVAIPSPIFSYAEIRKHLRFLPSTCFFTAALGLLCPLHLGLMPAAEQHCARTSARRVSSELSYFQLLAWPRVASWQLLDYPVALISNH
jgi:hypothetical protein